MRNRIDELVDSLLEAQDALVWATVDEDGEDIQRWLGQVEKCSANIVTAFREQQARIAALEAALSAAIDYLRALHDETGEGGGTLLMLKARLACGGQRRRSKREERDDSQD